MKLATTLVVIVATVAGLSVLARPRVRRSPTWRATVTPLASIIGSGFLVVAPLLAHVVGRWAPLAMAGIVGFAYVVGGIVRFNIHHLEPVLAGDDAPHLLVDVERVSRFALGFAYVVSVAFYLRLLASFVLRPITGDVTLGGQVLTTMLLAAIAALAWFRGLGGLEVLEEVAVTVKLAIIGGLLAALIAFDGFQWSETIDAFRSNGSSEDAWTIVRSLAGMILVVQGFETSRYLGEKYDRQMRARTMRFAQVISAVIYVAFILLMVPLFDAFPAVVDDTAILDAVSEVSVLLAPLILVAAVSSQLSAGVADTAGGGGMLAVAGNGPGEQRFGYLAVLVGAGAVVWATNVFAIIAFASRAFAVSYLMQAVLAFACAPQVASGPRLLLLRTGMAIVGAVLGFIAVFGIPAA